MKPHAAQQSAVYGTARLPHPPSYYASTPLADQGAPWFRVSADWPGGGFAFTLQFDDEARARAWTDARAAHHPGAVVEVQQRAEKECAELSAAEVDAMASDLHNHQLKTSGELQRRRDDDAMWAERNWLRA
jgi:hypothetical protein